MLTQMLDFGGLEIKKVGDFIERMQVLELLTNTMHIDMMEEMLARRAFDEVLARACVDTDGNRLPRDGAAWAASPHNTGQTHDDFGFEIEDTGLFEAEALHVAECGADAAKARRALLRFLGRFQGPYHTRTACSAC